MSVNTRWYKLPLNHIGTEGQGFGFRLSRVEGSHHIFIHPDIHELVNLQEVKEEAKPYQVRQLIKLIEKYNLHLEDE